MGSVRAYISAKGEKRYEVYYRDASHVSHHKRGFLTKKAARAYQAANEVAVENGTYVDPRDGLMTIEVLGRQWIEAHASIWKPSYRRSIDTAWRVHVEPEWGKRSLNSVRHSEVQAWVARLSKDKSPSVVLRAFGILKGIYEMAIEDRIVAHTPTERIQLPKKTAKRHVFLTAQQVQDLAEAAGYYRPLILVLGFCGLRWGEATGLLVSDVDFDRNRIIVSRSATKVGGRIEVGTTKTGNTREVSMPGLVAEALRQQAAGKSPEDLLFTDEHGGYVRQQSAAEGRRGWYAAAVKQSGVPRLRIHDLRHTAASIAISAGANPKYVQRMLGHKSAKMTLDTYSDLFDRDIDRVSDNIDHLIEQTS